MEGKMVCQTCNYKMEADRYNEILTVGETRKQHQNETTWWAYMDTGGSQNGRIRASVHAYGTIKWDHSNVFWP